MMKARLTYIPVDVADQLDDFIIKRDEKVLDAVKTRARDFSMLTLLKLLYQLSCNSMTFTDLYTNSKIRMKRSFLNYLKLCVDYDFVKKDPAGACMIYSITEKGRVLLGMFLIKSN